MVFRVAVPNAEYNLENNSGMRLDVTEILLPKESERQVNNHTLFLDIHQRHRPAQKM
jgi:hypothetical protein